MTKGDLRHQIFGRPFKPMAVGLIIGGTTLATAAWSWCGSGGAGLTHKGKLNKFLVYMVRSDQEET